MQKTLNSWNGSGWRWKRDVKQVKCWGFLRRTESCLQPRDITSCSSCITYNLPSTNHISHFSLSRIVSFLSPSFLSQRGPKGRPSRLSSHELTHTTHNSAWMVLPGARHAGKGLHHSEFAWVCVCEMKVQCEPSEASGLDFRLSWFCRDALFTWKSEDMSQCHTQQTSQ